MRFALLASLVFVALACRPTHYTGATVEMSRPGETKTINIGPEWEHVTLKSWREDNRQGNRSKVEGEIHRK